MVSVPYVSHPFPPLSVICSILPLLSSNPCILTAHLPSSPLLGGVPPPACLVPPCLTRHPVTMAVQAWGPVLAWAEPAWAWGAGLVWGRLCNGECGTHRPQVEGLQCFLEGEGGEGGGPVLRG